MRRGELFANLILFSPLILILIISISTGIVIQAPKGYFFLSIALLLIGFLCLLKSKIPNFKNKKYITFGTNGMTTTNSIFYYFGGIAAGVGAILSFGLLFWVLIK